VDDGAWFAPKRYGLGSGLPIRWQGWAVLVGYLALLVPFHFLLQMPGALPKMAALGMILAATIWLIDIARRKTRGGWKWRGGGED
jgi:hypothetical protein